MKLAAIGMVAMGLVAFSGLGIFAQDEVSPGESVSDTSEVAENNAFEFDLDESDRESIRTVVRNSLKGLEGINEHIEEVLDTAMDEMERALAGVESAINEIDFDQIETDVEEAIDSVSDDGLGGHLDGFEDIGEMIEEIFGFIGDWFEENFEGILEDWGENLGGLFEDIGQAFDDMEKKIDNAVDQNESSESPSVAEEIGK